MSAKKETGVMMQRNTVIERGKYRFSDKEKGEIANDLAKKQIDMKIVEDEKKSIMASYMDQLKRFLWDINRMSRDVVDGFEMRDFECIIEKDYKAHLKRYKDIHTGKIVAERPLDPSDYQQEFDEKKYKQKAVKKKAIKKKVAKKKVAKKKVVEKGKAKKCSTKK